MNIGKRLSVLLGFGWWVLMALTLTTGKHAWGQQSFSTFAEPDEEKLELIVGKWTINDRSYLYEYTPDFAKRIDGFAYYHYKISQFPHNTYLYAIFKSKKTGKSYFCRGKWHSRYGFQYSASRIEFMSEDIFVVYSKDDPGDVFMTAHRVKDNDKKKGKI